jgi:hypothetical protein
MSSIIKVDTIQDQDGNNIINENANTITIGKAGDTVSVAAGASFVGGGIEWQSTIVTTSTLTAVAGKGYWINTTSNACTVTLPASASVGDQIIFVDYARNWNTNSVTINTNGLNFQGNTSPNPNYNTNGETVSIVYSDATQGWIPIDDGAVALETPQNYSIDMLVIAGGGGGGGEAGGGGGAGGYRTSTQNFNTGATYTITVGDGGASHSGGGVSGNSGSDSSVSGTGITTITSAGGGAGGYYDANGLSGGSGGGGGGKIGASTGGSGNTPSTSPSQGNNGGNGDYPSSTRQAGGGGGAGAVGGNNGSNNAGDGGDGTASSITGSSVTRAGGGGGGTNNAGSPKSTGGTGGGGDGGNDSILATAGTVNTGSGGGGRGLHAPSAAGGKGVVILSIADGNYSGVTTGSPTVATGVSGKTILTFNGDGSYTA